MTEAKSYTGNYFRIYFWKFISYFTGFASIAVVTPRITNSAALFGIFAFCMSLNIFFQYADLGFLNAAQKYASEYYGKKDFENEIRVTGFSCFIFAMFIIPISLFMLWFAYNPELVIKGISSPKEIKLATGLLLSLCVFSPVIIIQRMVQIIFAVRLEDYYPQRISIVVSVIRILSVFYFFGNGRYLLLEYFIFYNAIGILSLFVTIRIAQKRYHYSFIKLIKYFRYSKEMYAKTSKLAINSFFLALSWIIFYELDLIYIGYFIGKDGVAFYALAATLLKFLRDLFGTFYYPFVVRFNHLVGLRDDDNLSSLYHTLLKVGASVCFIPVLSIFFFMKPIIFSWVGINYESSIIIGQILIASAVSGFITYPAGALLTAKEEINVLYVNAIILPVVFLLGVLSTQHWLGVKAYAIFKTVAIFVNALIMLHYTLKYLNISLKEFFTTYLLNLIIPIGIVALIGLTCQYYLNPTKGILYLAITGTLIGGTMLIGFSMNFLTDSFFRNFARSTLRKLLKK